LSISFVAVGLVVRLRDQAVQLLFRNVPKWWMSQVVREARRFDSINIDPSSAMPLYRATRLEAILLPICAISSECVSRL
jgi:hypothetical protein